MGDFRRQRWAFALLAVAFLLPVPSVADAIPVATCEIAFTGSSSLHDFEGSAPPVHATFEPASSTEHWNVRVAVPVATLTTDNDVRDTKMHEMMGLERAADIVVAIDEVDPQTVRERKRLEGRLTIGGVTKPFVAQVADWKEKDERISFDAESDISLSNFALSAPSVLGLIRVADEVHVHAHVSVERDGVTVSQ
jgi:polyisoprenoid-binding protein YceI